MTRSSASIRRYNFDRTKKILEERGHEVFSYKDPSDCPLGFLTECKCNHMNFCSDVIISDVSMPFVNGLDFVESLRGKGCKIRNIALISGFWTKKDISRAEKIGFTVFHKPNTATRTKCMA
jgi:CheY-like chemotaxis protein